MKHNIIDAKVLGFCSGVKLAMNIAIKAREDYPTKKIFTFGELIHNNEAIKFLGSKQIFALDKKTAISSTEDFSDAIIVICAHGIEFGAMEILRKKFDTVLDATCPHVLQSQKKVETFAKQNYNVIIVGEKNHQEVLSIKSHVELIDNKECKVVENVQEAKNLKISHSDLPICTIAQTTFKQSEYKLIIDVLEKKVLALFSDIPTTKTENNNITDIFKVYNTICSATQKRQDALIELAKNCNAILVVGGKNSTNTQRLYQTALNLQVNSFLVENAKEIPSDIFQFKTIGITAGASTPSFVLDEIKKILSDKT